jgi:membrane dipeptidase
MVRGPTTIPAHDFEPYSVVPMVDLPVLDGHNDVLLAVRGHREPPRSFFERSEAGHLDLPRALEGNLAGGFFAVFVPNELGSLERVTEDDLAALPVDPAHALRQSLALTALLFRLTAQSEGKLRVVRSLAELQATIVSPALAAILHFEGPEAIDPQLNVLEVLYQAGLRSLGLSWSRPNLFASGVPYGMGSPDTGPGLTPAGLALVGACNELGVMLDLSHLNERGFWDVARVSTAPLVATHSNVHALSPVTRNLTDRQIDAIAESGGVVGVSFAACFVRADGQSEADTPLADLVRHFAYVADRAGVDHLAFGSDFDGTVIPADIGDASGLPRLMTAMQQAGFSSADLKKIGYENWLRVLSQTWRQ